MTNSALDKDILDAVDNDNQPVPEKRIVWFVVEGRMHSSWIIGHMDIDIVVDPSSEFTDGMEVASNIMTDDREARGLLRNNTRLNAMLARPGRWFYLSGCQVQHGDDLYATKEAAAKAYTEFLLR